MHRLERSANLRDGIRVLARRFQGRVIRVMPGLQSAILPQKDIADLNHLIRIGQRQHLQDVRRAAFNRVGVFCLDLFRGGICFGCQGGGAKEAPGSHEEDFFHSGVFNSAGALFSKPSRISRGTGSAVPCLWFSGKETSRVTSVNVLKSRVFRAP